MKNNWDNSIKKSFKLENKVANRHFWTFGGCCATKPSLHKVTLNWICASVLKTAKRVLIANNVCSDEILLAMLPSLLTFK